MVADVVIVDVGANVGFFALEATRQVARMGGTPRMLCFEPVRPTFELLLKNVALLTPRLPAGSVVVPINWGVARKRETCVFQHAAGADAMSSRYEENHDTAGRDPMDTVRMLRDPALPKSYQKMLCKGVPMWLLRALPDKLLAAAVVKSFAALRSSLRPETVQLDTLSSLLRDAEACGHLAAGQRIALLKVDVEMAEEDALMGIDAADWARIDAAAVEVHDVDGRMERLARLLADRGLTEQKVSQEFVFRGSPIWSLTAVRQEVAAAAEAAAGLKGDGAALPVSSGGGGKAPPKPEPPPAAAAAVGGKAR